MPGGGEGKQGQIPGPRATSTYVCVGAPRELGLGPRRPPGISVSRCTDIPGTRFPGRVDLYSLRDGEKDPRGRAVPGMSSLGTLGLPTRSPKADTPAPPAPQWSQPHSGSWGGSWGLAGAFLTHKGRRERPGSPGRPHCWSHSATKRNHFQRGLRPPGVCRKPGKACGGRRGGSGAPRAFGPSAGAGPPAGRPHTSRVPPKRRTQGQEPDRPSSQPRAPQSRLEAWPRQPPCSSTSRGSYSSGASGPRLASLPSLQEPRRPVGSLGPWGPRGARDAMPPSRAAVPAATETGDKGVVAGALTEAAFSRPAGEFPAALLLDPDTEEARRAGAWHPEGEEPGLASFGSRQREAGSQAPRVSHAALAAPCGTGSP